MSELVLETAKEIPQGWKKTTLDSISHIIMGQSPPSKTYNSSKTGLPFYQGKTEFGEKFPTPKIWCNKPNKIAVLGDVLISVRAPVGAVNICPEESCIGRGLAAVRGLGGIQTEFVFYLLQSLKNKFIKKGTGTIFKAIGKDQLFQTEIMLPPLNEQKRIVAKIEDLFSKIIFCEELLIKIKNKLLVQKKSYFQSIFSGIQTKNWRITHGSENFPTDNFINVLVNNQKKNGNNFEKPVDLHVFSKFNLPSNWKWKLIGELSNVVRGGSPRPSGSPKYFGGSIPWITVKHLTNDSGMYLFSTDATLNEEGKKRSRFINYDTLLLTNSGATLGVPKITKITGCINDGIVAITEIDHPFKQYMYYYLSSLTSTLRMINQGAAQPNLNTSIVKSIPIPIPPEDEQIQIISEIEKFESNFIVVKKSINEITFNLENLKAMILSNAFKGKLVPQDTNDEPAEILLQKIKQEKEQLKLKEKKPRRKKNAR